MRRALWRLWKDESGQDLVEYALLIVLPAWATTATLGTLANTLKNTFSNAASTLTTTTQPLLDGGPKETTKHASIRMDSRRFLGARCRLD